ncbi:MAG: glycosyl hydrolase, partial [Clostridia bacterium]|nr:glycosyl hydrolase [Clostridia bacterium]
VNIGDTIPFSDDSADSDGRYHLFYLYDRHHHGSKWGLGAHQWAHVSTADFVTWDEHPMAVGITEPWEGSICTGSIVRAGDKFYAWYAVRMSDGSPARMTCAVSEDNAHFVKSGKYFTLPAGYEPSSARDPKVVEMDGKFHMFVTTTRLESGSGCLAHLVSDTADFAQFEDCGTILEWNDGNQPECPDWFAMGEYYYLIYSIGGYARYRYSKSPFDGWITPAEDNIPCGRVPKAACLGNQRIFAGFVTDHGYADDVIFVETIQKEDGTLDFVPFAR